MTKELQLEQYRIDYQRRKEYRLYYNKRCGRKQYLKQKYGITLEQHKQMFMAQNGKCAICNKIFDNPKIVCVDHNHKTNQIRQLLCVKCNSGLGYFDENIEALLNAVEYLK